MYRCPKCGNTQVTRKTTSVARATDASYFSTVYFVEFYCPNCGTLEDSRDDQPTYAPMEKRWAAPST